jgi:CheY-like chemotaxis protein
MVLVVDDDKDLREMVCAILSQAGMRTVEAANGREALDRVASEMPSCILLDMRMPVMDGWQFAREFRQTYDHLAPIIVVTAAADARARAIEAQAEAYLPKPFHLQDLVPLVTQQIARSALRPG